MSSLNLFPSRVAIGKLTRQTKDSAGRDITVEEEVLASPEFLRALTDLFERVGGANGLSVEELHLLMLQAMNPVPDVVAREAIADLERAQLATQGALIAKMARRIDELESLVATIPSLSAEVSRLRAGSADIEMAASSPMQYRVKWERPGKIGRLTPNTGSFTRLNAGAGSVPGTVAAPSFYLASDTATGFYRIALNNWGFSVNGTKLVDYSNQLVQIAGRVSVAAGSEALPGLYFGSDNTTGFYQVGAGVWGFSVAGVQLLQFSTALPLLNVTGNINATRQISTSIATGTSPFAVVSTTKVDNLHAETADVAHSLGTPGAYPADATNLATVITLANAIKAQNIFKGV